MRKIDITENEERLIKLVGTYGYVDTNLIREVLKISEVNMRLRRSLLIKNKYLESIYLSQEYKIGFANVKCRRAYKLDSKGIAMYESLTGTKPKLGEVNTEHPVTMEHQLCLAHVCERLKKIYSSFSPQILNERIVYDEETKVRPDACLIIKVPPNDRCIAYFIEYEHSKHNIESYISKVYRYNSFKNENKLKTNLSISGRKIDIFRVLYISKNKEMEKSIISAMAHINKEITHIDVETLVVDAIELFMQIDNKSQIFKNVLDSESKFHLLNKMEVSE